jgi:hypothetical protein
MCFPPLVVGLKLLALEGLPQASIDLRIDATGAALCGFDQPAPQLLAQAQRDVNDVSDFVRHRHTFDL